ncbi:hypothetical protein [Paraburkholderia sp.]|uniref:hypothetical protein n=1 Tax=Paraburkholderia sp. TaxID=1926495 RepID=UPI00286F3FE2|nr:hypothetical protein [Paraburkholderia sp.]
MPTFSKTPKPWYCAAEPICETSKLALVLPPSLSVSAALYATTLPLMTEVDQISSELTPPEDPAFSSQHPLCQKFQKRK